LRNLLSSTTLLPNARHWQQSAFFKKMVTMRTTRSNIKNILISAAACKFELCVGLKQWFLPYTALTDRFL
jgi:hypothetical protein